MLSYSLSCITAHLFGQTPLKETSLSFEAYRTSQHVLPPEQESMTMLHRHFTQLHWLPVRYTLRYRYTVLAFKFLKGCAPQYLSGRFNQRSKVHDRATRYIGSVSSRECLDAPAILATSTAGRTGLVACPWRHYNFNNYADNPHVDCINFIGFFLYRLEKKRNVKSISWNAS